MVKNPPASAGDLGSIPESGRSLEKEMATHSSILAWKIPWKMGVAKSQPQLSNFTKCLLYFQCINRSIDNDITSDKTKKLYLYVCVCVHIFSRAIFINTMCVV